MFLVKFCRVCKKFKIDMNDITTGRDKKNLAYYIKNKMVCDCGN